MASFLFGYLTAHALGSVWVMIFKAQPAAHRFIDLIITVLSGSLAAWVWFVAPVWQ